MKRLFVISMLVIFAAVGYAQTPEERFKGEPPLTQQDLDIFLANTQVYVEAGKQSNSVDVEKVMSAAGLNVNRNLYVWTKVVVNFKIYHGNELLGENFSADEIKQMEDGCPAPLKLNNKEKKLIDENKTAIKTAYDAIMKGLEGY